MSLKIWVDADACPNVIKDMLYRAAMRKKVELILVANQFLRVPASPYIRSIKVAAGFDVADQRIVDDSQAGDLVISADIPLVAAVIEKGGHALNPRGEFYTKDNIRERLSMRNFNDELRNSGVDTGGPSVYTAADSRQFANQLDRFLTKNVT